MSLTKYQIDLLINNDYNVGKFYIALNTKDDNGVNWFTYYDDQITRCTVEIAELKKELEIWEVADQFKREEIVSDANRKADEEVQKNIDEEKLIVRGLSRVIHEVTSMASDDKLDPQHISENNLMTDILEEIGNRNDLISELEKEIVGDILDLEKETILFGKSLKEDMEHFTKEVASHIENNKMMIDRQQWLQDTFEISENDKQKIITKYER